MFNPFDKPFSEVGSADLELLRDVHEGWYVDYKGAPISPKNTAKAIAAMANTYGGWVFIGIQEESKDNNVAGEFVGIAGNEVDKVCQGIRSAVALHLNAEPYFELRSVDAPGSNVGRKVICIRVPPSSRAPIIHSDARIYKRVSDASEPKPENDRNAVQHLFDRTKRIEERYADWVDNDPHLSVGEDGLSYLRILAVPDYWEEHDLWLGLKIDELVEVVEKPAKGVHFSATFQSYHSVPRGLVFRSTAGNDPLSLVHTVRIFRDLRNEVLIPIPSFDIEEYDKYQQKTDDLTNLVDFIKDSGYSHATAIDINTIFGVIDGFFTLQKNLEELAGYNGKTHAKIKLCNVWRRIPVASATPELLGWSKSGVPLILDETVTSGEGGITSGFMPLNLHRQKEDAESQNFMLSMPIFFELLNCVGMLTGPTDAVIKMSNTLTLNSYRAAKKEE